MKAVVAQDLCIGCGLCEEMCPEVFKMNEDAIAAVIVDTIPSEAEESAREAAASCPTEAITIED